jgi:hypothetical protein
MNPSIITAIISLVPNAEVVVRGSDSTAIIEWIRPSEAPVTREEIDTELERLIAKVPFDNCKSEAKTRIASADWAVLSDVGLANVDDFKSYRANLRGLILNPVIEPDFGTEPSPIWIK